MRIVKKLITISILASLMIGLTGCGKTSQLEAELAQYKSLYQAALNESIKYEETAKAVEAFNSSQPGIYHMPNGSNQLTFNSYDSRIIFPAEFAYPNSQSVAGEPKITVANVVGVSPNSNWIVKLLGSSIELEHTNGVSGLIKIAEINEDYDRKLLKQDVIEPWFENLKNDVSYNTIQVDGVTWGTQANCKIFIDEEPAYLYCGMIGYSGYAVTYTFVYRGEQSKSNDEVINTLVRGITIFEKNISISGN